MVIGGSATILGPLIGAAVLVFIQEQTTDLIEGKEILAPTVLGVALILIVYVLPEGVVGGYRRLGWVRAASLEGAWHVTAAGPHDRHHHP